MTGRDERPRHPNQAVPAASSRPPPATARRPAGRHSDGRLDGIGRHIQQLDAGRGSDHDMHGTSMATTWPAGGCRRVSTSRSRSQCHSLLTRNRDGLGGLQHDLAGPGEIGRVTARWIGCGESPRLGTSVAPLVGVSCETAFQGSAGFAASMPASGWAAAVRRLSVGSSSTVRPPSSTAIRSQSRSSTYRSWETTSAPVPPRPRPGTAAGSPRPAASRRGRRGLVGTITGTHGQRRAIATRCTDRSTARRAAAAQVADSHHLVELRGAGPARGPVTDAVVVQWLRHQPDRVRQG